MPELADAIFSAEDIEKELALESQELLQELEQLRAQRESASLARESRPSSRATRSDAVVAELPDGSSSASSAQAAAPKLEVPPRGAAASLADHILASSDAVDVDREFQAMEQELQQQLIKYKEQCQGVDCGAVAKDGGAHAQAAAAGQDAATTAGSGSWPSRPSSKSSALGKEQPTSNVANADLQAGEAVTPELLNLRAEATRMEEVFPDATEKAEELPAPAPMRHRRIRRTVRDTSSEDIPEDPETADLRQVLGSIDVRLGVIQQKHAMHDVLERGPNSSTPTAAMKAIGELRAQNAHLRDRFQTSNKRGLLGIDATVFGVVEPLRKPAEHT
jgi:hypothetical protein